MFWVLTALVLGPNCPYCQAIPIAYEHSLFCFACSGVGSSYFFMVLRTFRQANMAQDGPYGRPKSLQPLWGVPHLPHNRSYAKPFGIPEKKSVRALPEGAPRVPNMVPRWPQDGSRWPKIVPRQPQDRPRWSYMATDDCPGYVE